MQVQPLQPSASVIASSLPTRGVQETSHPILLKKTRSKSNALTSAASVTNPHGEGVGPGASRGGPAAQPAKRRGTGRASGGTSRATVGGANRGGSAPGRGSTLPIKKSSKPEGSPTEANVQKSPVSRTLQFQQ